MAILRSSLVRHTFGRWFYKPMPGQPWVPLRESRTAVNDSCSSLVLLRPEARLKFVPKNKTELWNDRDAVTGTSLKFYAWDLSDNRTTGPHCVDTKTISYSLNTALMVVPRLGCDGNPGSMETKDSCGICGGENECVGCDGAVNSTAKSGK